MLQYIEDSFMAMIATHNLGSVDSDTAVVKGRRSQLGVWRASSEPAQCDGRAEGMSIASVTFGGTRRKRRGGL